MELQADFATNQAASNYMIFSLFSHKEIILSYTCIYLEKGKDKIRSDSPTASKDAIKLALIIAANEGFKVQSGDIKSAYLQGEQLRRKVYVRPPKEANADGKLWLLLQGAYRIVDGGQLFYLRLLEKLSYSVRWCFVFIRDGWKTTWDCNNTL